MRKINSTLLIFGFIAFSMILAPSEIWADPLTVDKKDPTCSDVADASPFCKIGDAINNSTSGDIITVAAGTYVTGLLDISHPLTLVSDTGDYRSTETIITGLSEIVIKHDFTLQGFKFRDTTNERLDSTIDLKATGANHTITIEKNSFLNSETKSIRGTGDGTLVDLKINDNKIENAGEGNSRGHGIQIKSLGSGEITNNIIDTTAGSGIYLGQIGHVFQNFTIKNNIIKNVVGNGIQIANAGIGPNYISDNTITNTNIANLPYQGAISIWSNEDDVAEITNNILNNNYNGFVLCEDECFPGLFSSGQIGSISIEDNNIFDNNGFDDNGLGALNLASPAIVNATLNYWGHETGPYNAVENPDGEGDAISDNILFRPFMSEPREEISEVNQDPAICIDDSASPFCTINAAINAVNLRGTIFLASGDYYGIVNVDKNLSFIGEGADNTFLHDGWTLSNNVNISNLTSTGVNQTAAFTINTNSTFVFDGITIKDAEGEGILTPTLPSTNFYTSNITIKNSVFENNGLVSRGSPGDIKLDKFEGTLVVEDVTIIKGSESRGDINSHAIKLEGMWASPSPYVSCPSNSESTVESVTFNNVTISGSPNKAGILIECYSDMSGFSFDNVDLSGVNGIPSQFWPSSLLLNGNGGTSTLDLGNMKVTDITHASGHHVNATLVDFGVNDNFIIEENTFHGVDVVNAGLVTWVEDNLYISDNFVAEDYEPSLDTQNPFVNAMNLANSGDTINVGPRTYETGSIEISKSLTLQSDTGDYRTTQTILTGHSEFRIVGDTDDVTIQGFKFEDVTNVSYPATIHSLPALGQSQDNITIEKNSFDNTEKHTIQTNGTNYNFIINDNSIFDSGGFGVVNLADSGILDATYNYWGHESGPTHPDNPDGEGDEISENITFDPWYVNSELNVIGTNNVIEVNQDIAICVDDSASPFCTIAAAINNATSAITINIAAGTYPETITISSDVHNLTITGASADSKPVITGGIKFTNTELLDTITFDNLYIKGEGGNSHIIDAKFNPVRNFAISNSILDGDQVQDRMGLTPRNFTGSFSITDSEIKDIYGWSVIDTGEHTPDNDYAFSTVTFSGNHVHNNDGTVELGNNANTPATLIEISNNRIHDIGGNGALVDSHWAGIDLGNALQANVFDNSIDNVLPKPNQLPDSCSGSLEDPTCEYGYGIFLWGIELFTIYDNSITNTEHGIFISDIHRHGPTDISPAGTIHNNIISNNTKAGLSLIADDLASFDVNATYNYWGDSTGPFNAVNNPTGLGNQVSNNTAFAPWHLTSELTISTDDASGDTLTPDEDIIIFDSSTNSTEIIGQVSLPEDIIELVLHDGSVLDFSNNLDDLGDGNFTLGGNDYDIANFTSGDLTGENLTDPQIFGDIEVIVEYGLQLQSGNNTTPIIITNDDFPRVELSIPDGTIIMGSDGWDGTFVPPQAPSKDGNPPSGFSVGDFVFEIGSSDGVLLFDTPVTLTLFGVTGPVGYKPANSDDWIQITEKCGGEYADPDPPTFPGECYITNDTDTKILTYHFTGFGNLNKNPDSSPSPAASPSSESTYKSSSGRTGVGPGSSSSGGSYYGGISSSSSSYGGTSSEDTSSSSTSTSNNVDRSGNFAPDWFKTSVIQWWLNDSKYAISDEAFKNNITYLLDNNILDIDAPEYPSVQQQTEIPSSVKQLFTMWYNDQLDDLEIIKTIHHYRTMGLW